MGPAEQPEESSPVAVAQVSNELFDLFVKEYQGLDSISFDNIRKYLEKHPLNQGFLE
jgi:hypothetical protein